MTYINNRYRLLHLLGRGGMGEVFSAHDRLTGQTVALKRVTLFGDSEAASTRPDVNLTMPDASASPAANRRVALAQEFRALATLRHPHIISVYDYGFDDVRQPYLVMELLHDARTLLTAGTDTPLAQQVGLLMQLLAALAYLHRRGVVHRDLKPENVLVVAGENGTPTVKVLDFGLATARGAPGTAGTLAYIAPEVLQGYPVGHAADLYAVGVLAYQMAAARHPFQMEDPTTFIQQMLTRMPNLAPVETRDGQLAAVIGRLLSKRPEDRFESAADVLRALDGAAGVRLPDESRLLRESFLQAAAFVGREEPLAALRAALGEALQGRGSVWLVGGESGVGKSRLLEEFRVTALVSGAQVARGQALNGAGAPYQTWHDVIRHLALTPDVPVDDLSVLRAAVPELTAGDETLPDPAELDPGAAQARFIAAVDRLVTRQQGVTVLLLEDLHWAGVESLAVLRQMCRRAVGAPLLVVATYRSDERADLPASVPDAQTLRLERFGHGEVARLTRSMLGTAEQDVVALLEQESEGNAFFIVEIIRTLAEDAGRLERVGARTLPERVFAGGVQTVVRRRLQRVPPAARALLDHAAVIGRDLDLGVLRALIHAALSDPDGAALRAMPLDGWIQTCADAAILEAQGDGWRFAHDKLRETLLEDLPAAQRPVIHRRAAEAIEQVYPDHPGQAQALAGHWYHAGDAVRCLRYAIPAAEQSLNVSDARGTLVTLTRALDLLKDMPAETLRHERMVVLRLLGEAHWKLNDFDIAVSHFEQALTLTEALDDPATAAQAHNGIAFVFWLRGETAQARARAQAALEQARRGSTLREQVRAINMLGNTAEREGHPEEAGARFAEALALARQAGDQRSIASSLNNLGNLADERQDLDAARRYYHEALGICRAIGFRQGVAICLNNLGVASERLKDYDAALDCYRQAQALGEEIADRLHVANALTNQVFVHFARADDAQGAILLRQALTLVLDVRAAYLLLHQLVAAAWLYWRAGRLARAAELLGAAAADANADPDLMGIRLDPARAAIEAAEGRDLGADMARGAGQDVLALAAAVLAEGVL